MEVGLYYEENLRRILDKTIQAEYVNSSRALNYYWDMSAALSISNTRPLYRFPPGATPISSATASSTAP